MIIPVPRNAEVIRQWTILREIENARGAGVTIDELAALCGVTTRTIRRDLQALEEAGFPLFDDRSRDDGRTRWSINGQAFKGLSAGLTLVRALRACTSAGRCSSRCPARRSATTSRRAFDKLGRGADAAHAAVSRPAAARHRDQAGSDARPARGRSRRCAQQQVIARALEATLHRRQATLTYHSTSSERTKPYLVHPYRLAYAQGGLYLLAYVPEYQEVRTFAVERIQEISLLEERFTPVEELPDDGVSRLARRALGPARAGGDRVRGGGRRLRARPRPGIGSQRRSRSADGPRGDDAERLPRSRAQSWILSFGPFARVIVAGVAGARIAHQLGDALSQYAQAGETSANRQGHRHMIRLLAIDIDGTLLDSRGRLPDAHRQALGEASARGIAIALVTGRSFHFTQPVADLLAMPVTLIVNNGAVVKSGDGHHAAPPSAAAGRRARRARRRRARSRTAWPSCSIAHDERQIVFERMDWTHPHRRGYYEKNKAFIAAASPLDAAAHRGPDSGDVQRRRRADARAGGASSGRCRSPIAFRSRSPSTSCATSRSSTSTAPAARRDRRWRGGPRRAASRATRSWPSATT